MTNPLDGRVPIVPSGRSRNAGWIVAGILGAVLVVALVGGAFLLGQRSGVAPEPVAATEQAQSTMPPTPVPSTAASPTPSPSPTVATPGGKILVGAGSGTASACKGGPGTDISMALDAQRNSPITPEGAAEFAAAALRWANRWPVPTDAEFDIAEKQLFAPDATQEVAGLRGLYAGYESEYTSESTDFATDGKYYIDSVIEDRVIVSFVYRPVRNPPIDAAQRGSQTLTVRATDKGWQLVSIGSDNLHDPNELWEIGTPFADLGEC